MRKKKKITPKDILVQLCDTKIIARRGAQLYCREDEFWKPVSTEYASAFLRGKMTEEDAFEISTNTVKEVVQRVRQLERFEISVDKLAPDHLLRCKNGAVDLMTGKLETDVTGEFLYCNSFDYIPEATLRMAPEFERFCDTSLEKDKEKIRLLLQIIGYCISELQIVKVGFFLIGEANSGKSLILELVQSVVGDDYVTNIAFDKLGNRFNKSRLALSRVNICTELAGGKMKDIDFFKLVTAHERVTADNKGEAPFEFRVRTKLLTAGNVMPEIPEITGAEALLHRMIILRFNSSISPEKQDKMLLEKLLKEKDVIFSLAVNELVTLEKNGFSFAEPEDSKAFKAVIKDSVNSVEKFVEEMCILSPDGKVHLRDLWGEYLKYCDENGLEVKIKVTQFVQKILCFKGVTRGKFRLHSKPLSGFRGIEMNAREHWNIGTKEQEE